MLSTVERKFILSCIGSQLRSYSSLHRMAGDAGLNGTCKHYKRLAMLCIRELHRIRYSGEYPDTAVIDSTDWEID